MSKKSLAKEAADHAAKTHKVKDPVVIHTDEATDPESGKPVHLFRVVSAEKGNEPAQTIILDDGGKPVEARPGLETLFDRSVLTTGPAAGPGTPAAAITIQPNTNVLTLNPGQTIDETITVTIPKNAGSGKADVYFLADTTSSMGTILNAVKTGANNILTALTGLGIDMVFGVGNYRDFPTDPFAFQHQLSPTNAAPAVTAAINAWTPSGGGDFPEGQLFALNSLAVPPGGSIGWRTGSKRIIVWFGDAAGHDPICTAISGVPPITEASATAKLVAEGITVLAISTASPGLDNDPKTGASDYIPLCGAPGGLAGQGTRIAGATGGTFVTPINAGNIVNTIISLVSGAVASINNVKLVPSPPIAPFVTSITPAAGYGPLAGDKEHILKFEVRFTGIPCKPETQVVNGTLDVVADGSIVAAKKVQITVPACGGFVYSVKFVCGVQSECGCECGPVQPGKYSTEINIHNYQNKEVAIEKRFIPVVFAGAAVGREPRVAGPKATDKIVLPPHSATMDDCCRIAELLFGGVPPSPIPLTIGFIEITSREELSVTAVYTSSGLNSQGVDIDVEQIQGRKLNDSPPGHTPPPTHEPGKGDDKDTGGGGHDHDHGHDH
jgi:hypothetical protein